MSIFARILDFFLHIDVHLHDVIVRFGPVTYALLFAIIFAETGLVFIPFLPGDSLLFAAGAFAARGDLNVVLLIVLLCAAAVVGDTSNYLLGGLFGRTIFRDDRRFLSTANLKKAEDFYRDFGSKAVVFARFLPIFRSLVPFVAGMAKMEYRRFALWNVIGGVVWVLLLLGAGYFFGQMQVVERNFSLVILAIIVISFVPAIVEYVRAKRAAGARQ